MPHRFQLPSQKSQSHLDRRHLSSRKCMLLKAQLLTWILNIIMSNGNRLKYLIWLAVIWSFCIVILKWLVVTKPPIHYHISIYSLIYLFNLIYFESIGSNIRSHYPCIYCKNTIKMLVFIEKVCIIITSSI